jgi:hypothetical protein
MLKDFNFILSSIFRKYMSIMFPKFKSIMKNISSFKKHGVFRKYMSIMFEKFKLIKKNVSSFMENIQECLKLQFFYSVISWYGIIFPLLRF